MLRRRSRRRAKPVTNVVPARLVLSKGQRTDPLPEEIRAGIGAQDIRSNVYAPGLPPVERSLFSTELDVVRFAYEPLAWGSPRQRLQRIADRLEPSLIDRLAPENFGVFCGLRYRGRRRTQRLLYLEVEGGAWKGPFAARPLFVRIGAGRVSRLYLEASGVGSFQDVVDLSEALAGSRSSSELARVFARTVGVGRRVRAGTAVFSSNGDGTSKVELRLRGQMSEAESLPLVLEALPVTRRASFVNALRGADITINVVSFRLSRQGIVDAGLYGSPKGLL